MAKLTESYLRNMIKQVMNEMAGDYKTTMNSGLSLGNERLYDKIFSHLEELDRVSDGDGAVIAISKLAEKFGATDKEVIAVLNDQEFEYWTNLDLENGIVEVFAGGYENQ
jgi:hypothetical protein